MSKILSIQGRAVPVVGDDIDTDRIIPARYLKEITFSRMGEYPFYDERFAADGTKKDHAFNKPEFQGASVLLGNVNFGCGSSREHAPQSLLRWGIRAIVAESFAEIFAGNCVMLGTPTLVASKEDVARLQKLATDKPGTVFTVDLPSMEVKADTLAVKVTMPPSRRNALIDGTWDSTALLLANAEAVKAKATTLPHPAGRL